MNLDEALRGYVERPVPRGLEERILTRCRRRWSWRWPAMTLVAACALTVMVWSRLPVERLELRSPRPPAVSALPLRAQVTGHKRRRRQPHRPDAVQALWRFAQEHPEAASQLTAFREPELIAPLEIQPIVIEDLGDPK